MGWPGFGFSTAPQADAETIAAARAAREAMRPKFDPDDPFGHIQTPDPSRAIAAAEQASQYNMLAERARNQSEAPIAPPVPANICDGCFVTSPGGRKFFVDGIGQCCADCADLAASPYRPAKWETQPHEVRSNQ